MEKEKAQMRGVEPGSGAGGTKGVHKAPDFGETHTLGKEPPERWVLAGRESMNVQGMEASWNGLHPFGGSELASRTSRYTFTSFPSGPMRGGTLRHRCREGCRHRPTVGTFAAQ